MEPRASRPRFPGYGIAEDEDELIPWSWASERLEASRNYWVASTRPDGRPHAMPVWGVWLDETFWFGTGVDSQKARNLAANPAIVVHLESGDDVVILEGTVEVVEGVEAAEPANGAYERKYGWRAEPGDPAPLYRLVPRRGFAWRERDYPRSATRFDFGEE